MAWLRDPLERYDHYRRNGGDTTINSLLGRPLDAPVDGLVDANAVMEQYEKLIDFVKSCPYHLETEGYIFVHAGVDLTLPDWRKLVIMIRFGYVPLSMRPKIPQGK